MNANQPGIEYVGLYSNAAIADMAMFDEVDSLDRASSIDGRMQQSDDLAAVRNEWMATSASLAEQHERAEKAEAERDALQDTLASVLAELGRWCTAYSETLWRPIPEEAKAKDAVAADLLREMLPRVRESVLGVISQGNTPA